MNNSRYIIGVDTYSMDSNNPVGAVAVFDKQTKTVLHCDRVKSKLEMDNLISSFQKAYNGAIVIKEDGKC